MKRKLGFIGAICLTVAMSFSVSANQNLATKFLPTKNIIKATTAQTPTLENDLLNPTPQTNVQVDNDLLYLYNNNVYKNDFFKFNVTLDSNWTKPTYEVAHTFAFNQVEPEILFTYGDINTNPNSLAMGFTFTKIPPESSALGLNGLTEMTKVVFKEMPLEAGAVISNIGVTKNSNISGAPFNYFTFDLTSQGVTIKNYAYIGLKNDSMYIITIANVNNNNKTIASKALKNIVIQ